MTMHGNVSYTDNVVEIARNLIAELKKARDAGEFKGNIVIEDNGADKLSVECEEVNDAILIKLKY